MTPNSFIAVIQTYIIAVKHPNKADYYRPLKKVFAFAFGLRVGERSFLI
jgi:hypothetical protein